MDIPFRQEGVEAQNDTSDQSGGAEQPCNHFRRFPFRGQAGSAASQLDPRGRGMEPPVCTLCTRAAGMENQQIKSWSGWRALVQAV